VSGHGGRTRVWRRPGERYIPGAMVETKAHGGGSIMVWDGITMDSKTDLIIVRNGSLTAQRYMNEILDTQVRPFAQDVGQEFLFMHDNARPHVANVVQTYLRNHQIQTLPWPACSPDLNPIEHLWDKLGRAIKTRPNPPMTLEELEIALVEEWQRIPQEDIRRLIRSMPRRCNSVITARGGSTLY
jgi:DDE superfamily endonuclease